MNTALSPKSPVPISADHLRLYLSQKVDKGTLDIPPFPAVAMKLRQLVSSGEYRMSDLAAVVKKDQALAAAMLRVANSVHFKRNGLEVSTVERAVATLGADEACRIAIAATLGNTVMQTSPLSILRQTIWRQSLTSAIIAESLAYYRRLNADHGFMAGLLHDIGRLVAVVGLENILIERKFSGNLTTQEWMDVVDSFHVQIGGLVATKWNLSALLRESIAHHHEPSAARDHRNVVDVIVATDEIVKMIEDCPYLLPHDLTHLPSIQNDREADALMETLPLIPSFVNSLGGANPAWQHMPARINRPSSLLEGNRKTVDLAARWHRSNGDVDCRITTITEEGFICTCPAPMPEGGVSRIEITEEGQPALTVSGRILLTESDTTNMSEVRLFALPGIDKMAWERFYKRY
jgi:HD-like signal output (HDOD) protein